MAEILRQAPLLEQITSAIIETGAFNTQLNANGFSSYLEAVASSWSQNNPIYNLNIRNVQTEIKKESGFIVGQFSLERPISADFKFRCTVANHQSNGKLKLVKLGLGTNGLVAKTASATANKLLPDLNVLMQIGIGSQLSRRGIRLTDLKIAIYEDLFSLGLKGEQFF